MVYLELMSDLHNEVFNVVVLDEKFDFTNWSVNLVAQSRPGVKWLNDTIDDKRHSINVHISKNHSYSYQGLFRVLQTLNQLIVEQLDLDETIDPLGLSYLTIPLNTRDRPCTLIWPARERSVITCWLKGHIVKNQ